MSRIRTIKPELPHSETLGRVSRDARLLFVLLWTVADDAGRARANARLLASLLFPFDADAPAAVPVWLAELEAVDCIRRYTVDRSEYLEIPRWTSHQKIDRPGPSRHPAPPSVPPDAVPEAVIVPYPDNSTSLREDSRGFASPREDSRALDADLGPRKGPSTKADQLLAAARVREKSGGDAVPDPDPGNLCRQLTAAANRGIAARFGEQPSPLLATHGTTARALQALTEAGVAPDWAAACIEQLASELRTDRPPRSLGYFVPAAIDRWRAEQAHRDAVTLTPAATTAATGGTNDPLYFAAVKYAREGDAEWIAYCAEKGITWEAAA